MLWYGVVYNGTVRYVHGMARYVMKCHGMRCMVRYMAHAMVYHVAHKPAWYSEWYIMRHDGLVLCGMVWSGMLSV